MSPCGSAGWWPRGLQTPLCIQALPIMEGLAPLKVILGIPQAHQHLPPMWKFYDRESKIRHQCLNNYLWSSIPD